MTDRPYLLDVSRLVWRKWTGRLPTGIDRVCLAYVSHYRARALAVVKHKELRLVLNGRLSERMFDLLVSEQPRFRIALIRLLTRAAIAAAGRQMDSAGQIYLNIGHTGLDASGLPAWLKKQRVKPVFLIHDLIPITHPEFCREGECQRHTIRMDHVLQCAHGIVANSQATLQAMAEFAGARGAAMPSGLVSWLGVEDHGHVLPAPRGGHPYFVMIGTIEARKNHLLVLHTWERLVAELGNAAPKLFIIGQRGWEADEVFALLDRSSRLKTHVRELGRCDDATMAAMIDGARALLMPSFIEGFGIPVLESLQRGTPVIASDLAVFREIAGDIPLYVEALDGRGWEQAIRDMIDDSPERERQLQRIRSYHSPTWPDHFARVDQWLAGLYKHGS